jgi:hypothetical protein
MLRALAITITLAACSPSTPAPDAAPGIDAAPVDAQAPSSDTGPRAEVGALAADCAIYCQGFYVRQRHVVVPVRRSEAAFRADCAPACVSTATGMTATQVAEAITRLHCLDGLVDQSVCVGTGPHDTGPAQRLLQRHRDVRRHVHDGRRSTRRCTQP